MSDLKPDTESYQKIARNAKQPALLLDTWKKYLLRYFRTDNEGSYINGTKVETDCDKRSLYRWLYEGGSQVGFFRADEFLTAHGLSIDEYLDWCLDKRLKVWYTKDSKVERKLERKYGSE